ncbi:MAG: High-affinity zinc uptake system membrane protein ZnuB [Firmicutes bacterium ADurb.Bin300]|nr:MAG: High-affinity zinc uptake system membrane protein ZnuB [Firmicutes bacterium ADurb.Bin300]HOD01873.1 metal ABC transporter permease [Clostridiales bacterium]
MINALLNLISESSPYDWLSYGFMRNALLATLIITPLFGILGTMAVNNNMAFFSDALGHSALTGIALGVLLGIDNEIISLVAFGVIIALTVTRVKNTKTASTDTVISVFSSASIALGLVILSYGGGFAKYSAYLIGDILSISEAEILTLFFVLLAVMVIWALLYNKLLLLSVNRELAASRGVKVSLVENIFVLIVATVVMLSIKWIGILLINSLLILPAAAARNIARSSRQHLVFSVLIALFCGVFGLMSSFYLDTAAGATIVLALAVVFFICYLFRKK